MSEPGSVPYDTLVPDEIRAMSFGTAVHSTIRKECVNRHLCDEHGVRRPGVHWVFSLAVTPDDINEVRMRQMASTGSASQRLGVTRTGSTVV